MRFESAADSTAMDESIEESRKEIIRTCRVDPERADCNHRRSEKPPPLEDHVVPYLDGGPNIYQLGSVEDAAVTVWDQQVRALRLVEALFPERCRKRIGGAPRCGLRVAIVGGGAAGLTAAAAFALGGARKVRVYERSPVLLPLMRTADHRYVHPRVARWPDPGWHEGRARLPVLGWCAGSAPAVAKEILDSFDRVRWHVGEAIEIHTSAPIAPSLSAGRGTPFRRLMADHDLVVVAVGFGEDGVARGENPRVPGDDTPPYWNADPLHRVEARDHPRRKIAIVGSGDGALIDVARALVAGFEQGALVTALAQRRAFASLMRGIMAAEEEEWKAQPNRRLEPEWYLQREPREWDYAASELGRVLDWNPTKVTLLGSGLNTRSTQPLHRFLTAALCKTERLEFKKARVEGVYRSRNSRVVTTTNGSPHGPYDACYLRLGPPERGTRPIDYLLRDDFMDALNSLESCVRTWRPRPQHQWPLCRIFCNLRLYWCCATKWSPGESK